MNDQDPVQQQPLTPADGAIVAALVVAMAAAAAAGSREAMYGCFAAAGAWLLARLARQERSEREAAPAPALAPAEASEEPAERGGILWALQATPVGYRLGLLGLGIAFAGLGGDIVWHTVFGVEDGIARVIAPFHLLLFTGAGLLLTSPLRATYASQDYGERMSLRHALPVVVGLTLITALALFLFQWLSAFADWSPSVDVAALPASVRTDPAMVQSLQMVVLARIMISDLILIAALLTAIRRFRLPFGAMTMVYTLAALLTGALTNLRLWGAVLAAMVAGLVADALIAKLRPSAQDTRACRIVALGTSLAFPAAYLVALSVLHGRTLPFDLTLGTIGLTGIIGVTLSSIALPPAGPVAIEEAPVVKAVQPEPEAEPEPDAEDEAQRTRPRDAAMLRAAARLAGTAATREDPIETTVLCELLRGQTPAEVATAFEPPLRESDVVSLITETGARYRVWAGESLEHLDVVYLFLEAIPLRVRVGDTEEHDLLAAWGVTRHGRRMLLGLRPGSRDRATAWGALGADLVERGLHAPALVVADGAPGVWRVVEELWPGAATQHSLSHALDEATEGLDERTRRQVRSQITAALDEARSPAEAERALAQLVAEVGELSPVRMAMLGARVDRLTAHLSFPTEHQRRLRSADLLGRALGELAPGSASLPLTWAVLDRHVRGTRRMAFSMHAAAHLDQLRRRPTTSTPVHQASAAPEA